MVDAEPHPALLEALRQLEAILGTTVIADYSDDHTRWGLYRTAINAPEALPTLLRAVSVEQDASRLRGGWRSAGADRPAGTAGLGAGTRSIRSGVLRTANP